MLSPKLSRRIALAFSNLTGPQDFPERLKAVRALRGIQADSLSDLPRWIREMVLRGESKS